jgi:hypothetical protein
MRKVILFCLIIGFYSLLASCSKQDSIASLQDETLSFSGFSASYQTNSVKVSFTAAHEDKVAYYKIYSGSDGNQLCLIGQLPVDEKKGAHTYSYLDKFPKGSTMYYMIGYMTTDSSLMFYGDMAQASEPQ